MKKTLYILTAWLLLASLPASASGHAPVAGDPLPVATGASGECSGDSLSTPPQLLYFRFDRSLVDAGYRSNREALARLHALFSDRGIVSRIDSIRVRAYASPDGDAAYNRRLALRRARAVKGYLVWRYPGLNQNRILTSSHAEDWEVLRTALENDCNIPHREGVLRILALDLSSARKEALLKELHGGTVYRYIFRRILPDLRNASICTVYVRPMKHPDSEKPAAFNTTGLSSLLPLSQSQSSADFQSALLSDSAYNLYLADMYRRKPLRKPLLAVKTNLLFDAALMPNIEVELPIGKHNRYSLNGELMFPWWLMKDDKYCLQILMGGLEGRYWLGSREKRMNREVLTGHFLGLYAGGGKYDLQWDRNGYQGEFFIAAGVSYGYAHRIARNLRLEYNIGIGLLRTGYEHYHTLDNYQTLLWQNNGRYTYLGPTKLKVSLVWLLNRKVKLKKGGVR